ncbi:hypothetical protein pb186bvf_004630 [Paramecium bursaria]
MLFLLLSVVQCIELYRLQESRVNTFSLQVSDQPGPRKIQWIKFSELEDQNGPLLITLDTFDWNKYDELANKSQNNPVFFTYAQPQLEEDLMISASGTDAKQIQLQLEDFLCLYDLTGFKQNSPSTLLVLQIDSELPSSDILNFPQGTQHEVYFSIARNLYDIYEHNTRRERNIIFYITTTGQLDNFGLKNLFKKAEFQRFTNSIDTIFIFEVIKGNTIFVQYNEVTTQDIIEQQNHTLNLLKQFKQIQTSEKLIETNKDISIMIIKSEDRPTLLNNSHSNVNEIIQKIIIESMYGIAYNHQLLDHLFNQQLNNLFNLNRSPPNIQKDSRFITDLNNLLKQIFKHVVRVPLQYKEKKFYSSQVTQASVYKYVSAFVDLYLIAAIAAWVSVIYIFENINEQNRNYDLDYVKAIQDAEYGSINIYKFGKNNVFGKFYYLNTSQNEIKDIHQQRELLKHGNLIRYFGYNIEKDFFKSYEVHIQYYEYIPRTLLTEMLQRGTSFKEPEMWMLLEQLVDVCAYLHEQNLFLFHGNLDLKTIRYQKGKLKILDQFAFPNPKKENQDVFQIGVVFLKLMTYNNDLKIYDYGGNPIYDEIKQQLLGLYEKNQYTYQLICLVGMMLRRNNQLRPSCRDILQMLKYREKFGVVDTQNALQQSKLMHSRLDDNFINAYRSVTLDNPQPLFVATINYPSTRVLPRYVYERQICYPIKKGITIPQCARTLEVILQQSKQQYKQQPDKIQFKMFKKSPSKQPSQTTNYTSNQLIPGSQASAQNYFSENIKYSSKKSQSQITYSPHQSTQPNISQFQSN